ncbi:tRNA 2-selenouridine(34) synthase MnmH [Shewanella surugensis]|uniref:tRNA 2-selenouridine synthase n=1 Tax=Shewanella surugensis TaxID=212020 RepID=A0ABT0L8H1_9GAMM|nr:tRNA 2-selenouridine(34) synthase MnmH [Shewanella surugensis]MCL1124004.1 tRNA 2-selenouridine(34) synthase MnmH [Shewanella surugensis]
MLIDPIPSSSYPSIFINDHPLIDVRSPIEFNKGAFPHSCNHYLIHDNERELIGTCYKKHGQAAAINLGHSLIKGELKQQRTDNWLHSLKKKPNAYLYCFRGGLRSQLSQQWLKEAGYSVPYIEGGYKAMRQFLIRSTETISQSQPLLILSGSTGSGKTELLSRRKNTVDLEAIAHHRGSSFGQHYGAQPSQINFENTLAITLLKRQINSPAYLLLEDESYLIGRSAIPKCFYVKMQSANVLVLEETEENRISRIVKEYVINMRKEFIARLGCTNGIEAFQQYLRHGIRQIKKRLGGKLHDELQNALEHACKQHESKNTPDGHRVWIAHLLEQYYDPMYRYQLNKKSHKIIFQGSHQAIHQWLDDNL